MARMITILAVVDKDEKWDEMKAIYDDMSMTESYSGSKETEAIYEYFCNQEPRTDGRMYKRIEHNELHDDKSSESFYFFNPDRKDFAEAHFFVVVETS